jgi:hypothetical protein
LEHSDNKSTLVLKSILLFFNAILCTFLRS